MVCGVWCLLTGEVLLPSWDPACLLSPHFYSNLALQQQLFLLQEQSGQGGNNKMKIIANLLEREVYSV